MGARLAVLPSLSCCSEPIRQMLLAEMVEHTMRVVAGSDWVIDIGPGAGEAGGKLVACGPPAEVARNKISRTAPYLRKHLD